MIRKFTISNDPLIYEAWPDVALTPSGKMICVFTECKHHSDRSYTRLMLAESTDKGRTWSQKRPLTEATHGVPNYNNARISCLHDGRIAVVVDLICSERRSKDNDQCKIVMYFSSDDGVTWSKQIETSIRGIVPDKLLELESGRWIIATHVNDTKFGFLFEQLHYSDNHGQTWSAPVTVAKQEGLNLCEASLLPVSHGIIVAFTRENTGVGKDCYKTISDDGGEHWSAPIRFPLPGCHRPTAGRLNNGQILITHRFMQGGKGWIGNWTQNLFAALTDEISVIAQTRSDAWARILPIDFDRSPNSDTGYSGWVQFQDGEIYIVNYIVDDAWDKGQIRGYSLGMEDFLCSNEL